MTEVNNKIRAQYIRGTQGLMTKDANLFNTPVDQVLQTSILYRQKWLERIEKARDRAARRNLTTYNQERQTLHAWLHGPQAPPPNQHGDT